MVSFGGGGGTVEELHGPQLFDELVTITGVVEEVVSLTGVVVVVVTTGVVLVVQTDH